jgi:hypothetical protein
VLQVGVQLCPFCNWPVQLPKFPLAGASAVHALGWHDADEKVPTLQLDTPLTEYPLLQEGKHVPPWVNWLGQLPTAPFTGAVTWQEFGVQIAELRAPKLQLESLLGNRVYPALHLGAHVEPCAKDVGHSPATALSGAAKVQELGLQVAETNLPRLQLEKPLTV